MLFMELSKPGTFHPDFHECCLTSIDVPAHQELPRIGLSG